MADAFIKLHRKMLEWEWYDDQNTCRLWIHCLLKANWKPCRWHGIEINPGQFITSLNSLAEETGLTINQVRTALDHLKSTGEITSKSQAKCRIITVNAWSDYQGDHSQTTSRPQADHKQTTTDKEYKEYKEIKKYIFVPPSVDEVRAYCQERNNSVDPVTFVNFYESKGWMIGKNKMKDWRSAVRTWEQKDKDKAKNEKPKFDNYNQREYDYAALLKDIT